MGKNRYVLIPCLTVVLTCLGYSQSTHYSLLCNLTSAPDPNTYKGPVKFQVSVPGRSTSHLNVQQISGPISAVILQDISGSMKAPNALKASMNAVHDFVEVSAPEDRLALVNFNEEAYIDIQLKDLAEFKRALDDPALGKQLDPQGRTRLFDAIGAAVGYLKANSGKETDSLFIISDGEDNESQLSATALRKRVLDSRLRLYLLGLANPAPKSELRSRRELIDMVRESGGAVVSVSPSNSTAAQLSKASAAKPVYDASPEAMARIRQQVQSIHTLIARPLRLEFDLDATPANSAIPSISALTSQGELASGITTFCGQLTESK